MQKPRRSRILQIGVQALLAENQIRQGGEAPPRPPLLCNLKSIEPSPKRLDHVLSETQRNNALVAVSERIAIGNDLSCRLGNPGDPKSESLVAAETKDRLSG